MSMFSDFLQENGLNAESLTARSTALEALTVEQRDRYVARTDARREKKAYDAANAEKPTAYSRGVSENTVKRASEGQPLPRIVRKKLVRAVNSLLTSQKKDAIDWRALFADTTAKKGKSTKKK